jgi:hypothetical protein
VGEYADLHVENYVNGRWGTRISKPREYPETTKAAISGQRFHVVEVVHGKTNRFPGTQLVVCENTKESYWVWASKGVTGIRKDVCKVLEVDLSLVEALSRTGRKPYTPQD